MKFTKRGGVTLTCAFAETDTAVGSGEAALAALEREPFAALLTDLWMLDISGEKLARRRVGVFCAAGADNVV